MLSDTEKKVVGAFMAFLRDRVEGLSSDNAESVEVSLQCLESAFGELNAATVGPLPPLLDLCQKWESSRTVSPEDEARAEVFKGEGNDLMKDNKFTEALEKYSEAIRIRPSPVFHCNRAAAYTKLDKYDDALADCRAAVALDPGHSKAYARMGLVHSCRGEHGKAVECYQKAIDLDPGNQSYQNNLNVAQQKVREAAGGGGQGAGMPAGGGMPAGMFPPGFPGLGGEGGMPDMSQLLGNPALMQMATQMMSNPQIQTFMGSLMQSAGTQPQGGQGLAGLMEAGQTLASQMQQQNPELVEQLRRQFQGQPGEEGGPPGSGENNPGDNNPPPDSGSSGGDKKD